MVLLLGLVIIAAAIIAVIRGVDVRLALLLAALALGVLAGQPLAILQQFLTTLSDEKFVVPICCAMGFAHVLRLTQCDQHLVHLLVRPLRRARAFLIPGTVLVGFCVNIPVISQTSTAITIGAVLIPLLLAARISPITVGAALLLGSSLGGELLNPGAPELRSMVEAIGNAQAASPMNVTSAECVRRILPLILIELAVATALFWFLCVRFKARRDREPAEATFDAEKEESLFHVNVAKAMVPLIPLVLLFLVARPFEVFQLPKQLLDPRPDHPAFDSRLIGAAMLLGVVVASVLVPRSAPQAARAFFEGAGYAFTHIISLIVAATCLGEGVKLIGLARWIGDFINEVPGVLLPAAGLLPFGFALLCGSGMAATQSLIGFFVPPALEQRLDPGHVGAVVAIAAAAGRTCSPVAAVTLMVAALTRTEAIALVKRLWLPLVVAGIIMVAASILLASATALVYTE